MLDPAELLALARVLCGENSGVTPNDAELRRAVSTAYYAVFHTVLRAAAQRFAGSNQTPAYVLLYRGFDHRHMRDVCERLQNATLKAKDAAALGRPSVSQDMRNFASAFSSLQEDRHAADYDPGSAYEQPDVQSIIESARDAIDAFEKVDATERADVLALLLVRTRS